MRELSLRGAGLRILLGVWTWVAILPAPTVAQTTIRAQDDTVFTRQDVAVEIDVLANDVLPEAGIFVVESIVQAPRHGSTVLVDGGRRIRYSPNAGFVGSDSFVYRVLNAPAGLTQAPEDLEAAVLITVRPPQETNRPPTAVDDSATTREDVSVGIPVVANDSDPDGDSLFLPSAGFLVSPPAAGRVLRLSNDELQYVPDPDFHGTDAFTYRVTDGREGSFAEAAVAVIIEPVADAPRAADDLATTAEAVAVEIDVLTNDFDPDGDSLSLGPEAIVFQPSEGSVEIVAGERFRYRPRPGFVGEDSFIYRVDDPAGTPATRLPTPENQATVLITVTLGQPPVAVDDAAEVPPAVAVEVDVLANDFDPEGTRLVLAASPIVEAPSHGTVAVTEGGWLAYRAEDRFSGTDSLVYAVTDATGQSATARLTLTVVNTPPVAGNDAVGTHVASAVEIDVLANDSDPDGHLVRLASPALVKTPASGTVERLAGGAFRYLPEPGFEGADGFTYRITDGQGGTATGQVVVEVTNTPPVAVFDSVLTGLGAEVAIDAVANDFDPDDDRVVLAADPVVAPPENGRLRVEAGRFLYTPQRRFEGVDRFRYRITDGFGAFAEGTVEIQVTEGAPPVVTELRPRTVREGRVTTLHLEGTHLAGANVFVATAPPQDEESPRVYPGLLRVRPVPHGRQVTLDLDATDPRVTGFYSLIVETPLGATGVEVRVVPEQAPVVDLVSPTEVEPGVIYPLLVTGANLDGTRVTASHPGVQLLELDTSDPERIAGLLAVDSTAAPGGFTLRLARRGGEAVIPMQVVAAGAAELESSVLTPGGTAGVGVSDAARELGAAGGVSVEAAGQRVGDTTSLTAPRALFQSPRVLPGLTSRFLAAQEQALALSQLGVQVAGVEEDSLGCLLSFQERFRLFQVVAAVAVDEAGDLDPGGLQGMILGSTRTQRVLTFSAFVDVFLSVQVDLCSGRLLSFCIGGAVGFELPNFPGIPTTARGGVVGFLFCLPQGLFLTEPGVSDGQMSRFDLAGDRCAVVTEDPLNREQGSVFPDVTLVRCCSERLRIALEGVAFGGTAFARSYDTQGDFVEVSPDLASCDEEDPDGGGELMIFLDANNDNPAEPGDPANPDEPRQLVPLSELSDVDRYLPCTDPRTGESVLPGALPQRMSLQVAFVERQGNQVRIVAPPGNTTRVELALLDTSTFPGQAMNWPPLDAPQPGADFFLRQGLQITDALFDADTDIATVPFSCNDYGGFTTIQAVAGGATARLEVPIPQLNPTGPPLPLIGWTATPSGKVDSAGLQARDDLDDVPEVTGLPDRALVGDGLTVFGEYRGFVSLGRHIRTDPGHKDAFLFIDSPDILSAATDFSQLGLRFQRVEELEFARFPSVTPDGSDVELRLVDFQGVSDIRAGGGQGVIRLQALPGNFDENNNRHQLGVTNADLTVSSFSPDSVIFTGVIEGLIRRKQNRRITEEDLSQWTIMHELGHAVHICHREEDRNGRPLDENDQIIRDGRCPEDGAFLIPQAKLPSKVYFMHSGNVINAILNDGKSHASAPTSYHENSLQQIRIHPNEGSP